MKTNYTSRSFFLVFLSILIITLAACDSKDETPTLAPTVAIAAATDTAVPPTNTPTPEPTDVPPPATPTPLPTLTPAPTATLTQTPLEQAQAATVRVVAQGSEYLEVLIGSGTGFIYDSSGLVLTSNHLVEGAGLVQVYVEGREDSITAEVIGRSPCDNLAVLKLLGSDFPAFDIGTADGLEDNVQVIGYVSGDSVQGVEETGLVDQEPSETVLTAGFSAITGTVELDTVLDNGFSGGPMVTTDGRITGMIIFSGLGGRPATALPLSFIGSLVDQLEVGNNQNWIGLNAGYLTAEDADLLGINAEPGLFAYAVDFRGPAGAADVRSGDFITEIGGNDVTGEDGFELYCNALRTYSEGDTLDITVLRGGDRLVGQINGDLLAEEVVVVEAPPEEETTQPSTGGASSSLLTIMQNTDAGIRSIGGTIDSLANNGCLGMVPADSGSGGTPGMAGPAAEIKAHPGCIHSISDCQIILDQYAIIANPPAVDLTNASPAEVNANASHQAAINTFTSRANPLYEACRAFVTDPNLTISPLAFGLARQGVDEALAILVPAIQTLQG